MRVGGTVGESLGIGDQWWIPVVVVGLLYFVYQHLSFLLTQNSDDCPYEHGGMKLIRLVSVTTHHHCLHAYRVKGAVVGVGTQGTAWRGSVSFPMTWDLHHHHDSGGRVSVMLPPVGSQLQLRFVRGGLGGVSSWVAERAIYCCSAIPRKSFDVDVVGCALEALPPP